MAGFNLGNFSDQFSMSMPSADVSSGGGLQQTLQQIGTVFQGINAITTSGLSIYNSLKQPKQPTPQQPSMNLGSGPQGLQAAGGANLQRLAPQTNAQPMKIGGESQLEGLKLPTNSKHLDALLSILGAYRG